MPSVEKIIEKMKRQPNGIRPEEADKVLRAYGYEGVRQKGSHKQYLNRAYVLETGSVVLSGTGQELLESDEIQKAYLGG